VLAAELQPYFDPSAPDQLMELSAGRLSARHLVRGLQPWLTAPVGEEDPEGKRRTNRTQGGTPQGGVLSPLLAHRYWHLCDRGVLWYGRATGRAAKRVREADAFGILRRGGGKETLKQVKHVVARLE